jgi:cytochrome b involved in lipid metabolism
MSEGTPSSILPFRSHTNILSVREISAPRILCVIQGLVHDVSAFASEHPGGEAVIRAAAGKDVTRLFLGETYTHSNAAHNVGIYQFYAH